MITKEALRNERTGDFPDLKSHIDELSEELSKVIKENLDDIEGELDNIFPEERTQYTELPTGESVKLDIKPDKLKLIDTQITQLLSGIGFADQLTDIINNFNADTLENTSNFEKSKIERQLEDKTGVSGISLDIDVRDTFAFENLKNQAAQNMTGVEDAVKEQVRNTLTDVGDEGGNVSDATHALRDRVDEIGDNHSRLVARTETLQASRTGSQALAEGSNLIGGKAWGATNDSRTREWHKVMDGVIISKDDEFRVPKVASNKQPDDYPRSTMVVGGDQPYNCRCYQASVLKDDLPPSLKSLWKEYPEIEVKGEKYSDLTRKQKQIYNKHSKEDESFKMMLKRLDSPPFSRRDVIEKFSISQKTYYDWMKNKDLY